MTVATPTSAPVGEQSQMYNCDPSNRGATLIINRMNMIIISYLYAIINRMNRLKMDITFSLRDCELACIEFV